MSEYIEKKVVLDWLESRDHTIREKAVDAFRNKAFYVSSLYGGVLDGYTETKQFINSLPTQEDKPVVNIETEFTRFMDRIGKPYHFSIELEQENYCREVAEYFYNLNSRKSWGMVWAKLNKDVDIRDDMFPLLLLRDDGKISLWRRPFLFTLLFFSPINKLMRHKYTYLLEIKKP